MPPFINIQKAAFTLQPNREKNIADKLGQILVNDGIIKPLQLTKALTYLNKDPHKKLGEVLQNLKYITPEQLAQGLAKQLGIRCHASGEVQPSNEALELIPVKYAVQHTILPLAVVGDKLEVLIANPGDVEVIHMLNFLSGKFIDPICSTTSLINKYIDAYYPAHDDGEILKQLELENPKDDLSGEKALVLAKEKPTVQLVNNIINHAIIKSASDIHIRPQENTVDLIYRVNGDLLTQRVFPKSILNAVASRIKILGGMDITEHRIPQDGSIRAKHNDKIIDMRISIMPSIYGDSIVIRLLEASEKDISLEDLGLSDVDTVKFKACLDKGSGLILVTGPTGSGKSTTLYSALQHIRNRNINIITLENPVEYRLKGVTQIQINEDVGYSFPKALRNVLRHDPDAIMVGEMRDEETASVAIESSLTGHLVLSTLHTNDSVSTITRLIEMGIKDYLIRSTLIASLSQRLVKRNCKFCLEKQLVPEYEAKQLEIMHGTHFYKSKGCPKCHNTGYKGRVAVYELLIIDDKIKPLIKEGVSTDVLKDTALKSGYLTLHNSAVKMAKKGIINLEQVQVIYNA